MSNAPIIVDTNTKIDLSLFFMIAVRPVIKAIIPEANPANIGKDTPGLATISSGIVFPAGTDS